MHLSIDKKDEDDFQRGKLIQMTFLRCFRTLDRYLRWRCSKMRPETKSVQGCPCECVSLAFAFCRQFLKVIDNMREKCLHWTPKETLLKVLEESKYIEEYKVWHPVSIKNACWLQCMSQDTIRRLVL